MRVGSRCGRWTWSLGRALNDVISGQCVFIKLSNLISLLVVFILISVTSPSIINPRSHFYFFKTKVFVCSIFSSRKLLKENRDINSFSILLLPQKWTFELP